MDHLISITLNTDTTQQERLRSLQTTFSKACSAVAEVAIAHHCWNRVALHHMVYREMRARFPELGAQMICNAVYSTCRACRLIFQHPKSPLNALLKTRESLPLIRFDPSAPVYFDRHTLSLREGVLSLFTLEGRMKFRITLSKVQEALFHTEKLKEICLTEQQGIFLLRFRLGQPDQIPTQEELDFPEYLVIDENTITSLKGKESSMPSLVISPQGSAQ